VAGPPVFRAPSDPPARSPAPSTLVAHGKPRPRGFEETYDGDSAECDAL